VPPPGYALVFPAVAPNGQPLAGFGDRLLAYLLDSLIVGVASLVFLVPIFLVTVTVIGNNQTWGNGTTTFPNSSVLLAILVAEAAGAVVTVLITYVYQVEMMHRSGQTVGKRVLRIRVICLDPSATLTRGVAAKRWLIGNLVGAVVPLFGWLDGLWQTWDKPYQQCLHDRVARTVVVKE
jgi:uncharacterized RDD family membrane protein YckC